METLELSIESINDTDRLGRALAEHLPPGTVVSLIGTLGAGKTRLVQAAAQSLGNSRDEITSPTFVLVNEYRRGRVPVFHFDAYRLKDEDEFLQLGPEEYFRGDGLSFIEWGDRVERCLPTDAVRLEIAVLDGEQRRVTLTGLPRDTVARVRESWG